MTGPLSSRGGSGLGRVMARALVTAGSRVVLVGRTKDTLLETADELGHESTRVCVADVAEPESVSGLSLSWRTSR
jgi:NADP-dependent 3-hydroxy acid dehydrogenase YdfG